MPQVVYAFIPPHKKHRAPSNICSVFLLYYFVNYLSDMADSSIEENAEYGPSPIKKGKSGKIISEDLRIRVVNMYKCIIQDEPTISMRRIRDQIAEVVC
ncbi:hypothetical protein QTP88_026022 [Uroleucon formosanum]